MSEAAITAAIAARKSIAFFANNYRRVGDPHLVGVAAANGKHQLELYQTGGDSSDKKGKLPSWKHFDIQDISGIQTLDQTFSPRSDFNSQSKRWSRVIASVR